LIAEVANIVLLSRIAGHAQPDVTLRVYSHLMHDGVLEAADRFDPLEWRTISRIAEEGG
jgi:hypothetical protein